MDFPLLLKLNANEMANKRIIRFTVFLFLFLNCTIGYSQDIIRIQNHSFEQTSSRGFWFDCGGIKYPEESPPDIITNGNYLFGIRQKAHDGSKYLSLVVRYDYTWESITQDLYDTLEVGKCYKFTVWLSRSNYFKSHTRRAQSVPENFTQPAVFVLWGGNKDCERKEILARSPAIESKDWLLHTFIIKPKRDYHHITLEVFYDELLNGPYNGHILVDNLSHFSEIECR